MLINHTRRLFLHQGVVHADPPGNLSPQDVKMLLAEADPSLANADIDGPTYREVPGYDGHSEVWEFSRGVGAKGARRAAGAAVDADTPGAVEALIADDPFLQALAHPERVQGSVLASPGQPLEGKIYFTTLPQPKDAFVSALSSAKASHGNTVLPPSNSLPAII